MRIRTRDAGAKRHPDAPSIWDAIDHVQVALGAGRYESFVSRGDARLVALALALGPDGTGKVRSATNLGNGAAHMLPDGTSSRANGVVTVWSAAGVQIAQYWTLRGGKRKHDAAADKRAALAARTPEQVEADRAAQRARMAAQRAARTPEQVEAHRLRERERDAARRDAKQALALALLADGGAMRA